jgi:hypothetical protein
MNDGLTDGWMDAGWMNLRTDGRTGGLMDGVMMDGSLDQWMNCWM